MLRTRRRSICRLAGRGGIYLGCLWLLAACHGDDPPDWPSVAARAAAAVVAVGDGEQTLGSAFALTPTTLASSAHLLRRAPIYRIAADGTRTPLTLLREDSDFDVALLRTTEPLPVTLALAVAAPRVAEPVLCLGNPFGGGLVVSLGIVSALPDALPSSRLLQTDAAIHPGNSGGPMLDRHGRVVGMLVGRLEGAGGPGFAVPAARIRALLEASGSRD